MNTTERFQPFTSNGVQTVVVVAGHQGSWGTSSQTFSSAEAAERWTIDQCRYWQSYTDHIELMYYGYDPGVYDDDGELIGTDGYPDAVGMWDEDAETITWERA